MYDIVRFIGKVLRALGLLILPQKSERELLFDTQIATLKKNRAIPEYVVRFLQLQKPRVLVRSSAMTPFGTIPFVPVIPASVWSLDALVAMVQRNGLTGLNRLDPATISNTVVVPSGPYYMFDIEDGVSTCGISPEDGEKDFALQFQERSFLTADEIIALATHTNVLSRHFLWAVNSRHRRDREELEELLVPNIDLSHRGRPYLGAGYADAAASEFGIPSCRTRGI